MARPHGRGCVVICLYTGCMINTMHPIVDSILAPSGLATLLVVAAAGAFFMFRRRALTGYLLATAALLYVIFGSSFTTFWLMGNLEREFAPGQDAAASASPGTVVVLTGYAFVDAHRSITGHVNSASSSRLLETMRLVARSRHMAVIISGGGEVPAIMKELLVQLGVRRTNIVTESNSANTYESAVHLRERLSSKPFYLVTSAGHMPRALRVFRKQGLSAIPAPTDYLSPATLTDASFIPSGRNLAISDLAVHEHLGMLWYRLLDRI